MTSTDLPGVSWRKSSHSNSDGGECVEVCDDFPSVVPVRDGKCPEGPALVLGNVRWSTFVNAVKAGTVSDQAVSLVL
ncbi:DUF397 domain-containing protein [Streptomyces sp. NPDC049954]|uniref:DUF397 domain-containing protein n=1 Tax=Streptomyces sp. NPDC049954 TaxID=3155779 RepID=UPI00341CCFD6